MNIGAIVELIKADPTILDDIQGFLDKMNIRDIQQVVQEAIVVKQQVTKSTSIAEMNGGVATKKNVQDAQDFIAQEPLNLETQKRINKVTSAILTGDAKSSQDIIAKFSEDLTVDDGG